MHEAHDTIQSDSNLIRDGLATLGIELGSTRIKASLIAPDGAPLASGSYEWENQLSDGIWTYDLNDVWKGIAGCYASLAENVRDLHAVEITSMAALGLSGMMHGYIALDVSGRLLVPFRTWRNNITAMACERLTTLFNFPIPQRWSVAHLYQSILDDQEHVRNIDYLTTLAGYVHYRLTGNRVLGIGDASGMFPIDPNTKDYDQAMVEQFDSLVANKDYPWKLKSILPEVKVAGDRAGKVTPAGARLLDPTGRLKPGIPLCPPEGDAETGMVATNSVRPRTGNVSAGTSVFAMVVLERNLKSAHKEIDIVMTPDGRPAGMAHANNGSSDLDAWIDLFGQTARVLGFNASMSDLYSKLTPLALQADSDAGGLLHISYVSGEHISGFTEGRPLFVRKPDSVFTLSNFMRSLLFTSLCALRIGLDILTEDEGMALDEIRGHGGFFKQGETGQRMMAAALNAPVSLLSTAGEGGAWGAALLAAYMIGNSKRQSLPDYLDDHIAASIGEAIKPDPDDVAGFQSYLERYKRGLSIEAEALKT